MIILQEIKHISSTKKDLRKFGIAVGIVLTLISAFLWYKDSSYYIAFLSSGGALILLGLALPSILKPIYYPWMIFAVVMGFIMTRVILTFFFFVILTPVSLLMRAFGKDPLNRKIDKDASTYWIEKEYLIKDNSRYEKYF